jgi:hypothetical protein
MLRVCFGARGRNGRLPSPPPTPPLSRLAYGTAVMGTAATGAAGVGIETRPDTGGAMLQA